MSDLGVIIVSGLPGSGKSTIAEGVAEKLRLPLFSVDPVESAIIKSGIERSFATGLAAYLVAEALATEQLQCGLSVIIDAVSPVQEARDMWRGLSKKNHARLLIIECICSDRGMHRKRIESRVRNMHGLPEVTWDDVEHRRNEYAQWTEERLVLDTTSSEDRLRLIERAVAYVDARMKTRS